MWYGAPTNDEDWTMADDVKGSPQFPVGTKVTSGLFIDSDIAKIVHKARWDGTEYAYTLVDEHGTIDTGYMARHLKKADADNDEIVSQFVADMEEIDGMALQRETIDGLEKQLTQWRDNASTLRAALLLAKAYLSPDRQHCLVHVSSQVTVGHVVDGALAQDAQLLKGDPE